MGSIARPLATEPLAVASGSKPLAIASGSAFEQELAADERG